jgi:hypothetical protein
MIALDILVVIIWIGCFVVVSIDSAYRKISPVFWRLAGLFGGPFALVAYGIVREKRSG